MSCAKINKGVTAPATCVKRSGGVRRLLIAAKIAISSVAENACKTVVNQILLNNLVNNPLTGDAEHKFYEYALKEKTTSFKETTTVNEDEDSTIFVPEIVGRIASDSPEALCALRELAEKRVPVVALVQENGSDGRWRVVGLGGGESQGLYLTETVYESGTKLNETTGILPSFKFSTTALVEGYRYFDAGTPLATNDAITDLLA